MNKVDLRLLKVLLNKQITEKFSFKKGGKKPDAAGIVLHIFLTLAIAAVFLLFFVNFAKMYLALTVRGVADVNARQTELMTAVYCLMLIGLIVSAVGNINGALFKGDDIKILSAMPINSNTLFMSKMAVIYLKQFVYSAVVVGVVNGSLGALNPQSVWYIVFSVITAFLLPLISVAVASLFAMPAHYLRKFVHTHFAWGAALITLLTVCGILLYSVLLDAMRQILVGDELKFFFSNAVMDKIAAFAAAAYPVKWITDLLFAQNILFSAIALTALVALCAVLATIIIKRLFVGALQRKIQTKAVFKDRRKKNYRQKSVFAALVQKEFSLILRTPSYAFSYFAVAVIMPLMVYFCMSIGTAMLQTLVFADCSLELAVFCNIIMGVLTNTFCATNVSRDGEVFYSVKAMPVLGRQVIFSKVAFCSVVMSLSNLAAAAVLFATGMLNVWQALFVCITGALFGFAQICFATRKDFRYPTFSTEDDGVIRESTNTVSAILVVGLLGAIVIGGALLYMSLATALGIVKIASVWTYVITGAISAALAAAAYVYLVRGLEKHYADFNKGF